MQPFFVFRPLSRGKPHVCGAHAFSSECRLNALSAAIVPLWSAGLRCRPDSVPESAVRARNIRRFKSTKTTLPGRFGNKWPESGARGLLIAYSGETSS